MHLVLDQDAAWIANKDPSQEYPLYLQPSISSHVHTNQYLTYGYRNPLFTIPSNHAHLPKGGASSSNRSPASSQTVAATDSSIDAETSGTASDIETNWEEGENGRDHVYNEICKANQGIRLKIGQVRQNRARRLFTEPKKQKEIDLLMGEFYTIFKRARADARTCAGGHNSASQASVQETALTNDRTSTNAAGTKHRISDGGFRLDDEEEDEEDRAPKRSKPLSKSPDNKLPTLKFACPYHQHNPRKYGIGEMYPTLWTTDLVLDPDGYRWCVSIKLNPS